MKRYKVLNADMTTPFRNFKMVHGEEYTCNNFNKNKNVDCSNGFYATKLDGLIYSFNIYRKVFECQVFGEKVEINQFKMRYEKIKLIREIPHEELKELVKPLDLKLGYKYSEVLFPFDPRVVLNEPTQKDFENLKKWASVRASVGDSVWDSVGASVWASVGDSVWASVGDSVRDSVWASVRDSVWASVWDSVGASVRASVRDSVWASVRDSVGDSVRAYTSNLFPNIKKWKYIEHKECINPFQSTIDLWYRGFIPIKIIDNWELYQCQTGKRFNN